MKITQEQINELLNDLNTSDLEGGVVIEADEESPF